MIIILFHFSLFIFIYTWEIISYKYAKNCYKIYWYKLQKSTGLRDCRVGAKRRKESFHLLVWKPPENYIPYVLEAENSIRRHQYKKRRASGTLF